MGIKDNYLSVWNSEGLDDLVSPETSSGMGLGQGLKACEMQKDFDDQD